MTYKRKHQQGILEIIIMVLLKSLWFLLSWPIKKVLRIKNKELRINKVENLRRWLEIEKMLESGDEIHAKQAVMEADKFFNAMMKRLGAKGEGFGNRLRSLEDHFSQVVYQKVWNAHKVRNQISHEMDYKLSEGEARRTLENFRSGLHGLGAI